MSRRRPKVGATSSVAPSRRPGSSTDSTRMPSAGRPSRSVLTPAGGGACPRRASLRGSHARTPPPPVVAEKAHTPVGCGSLQRETTVPGSLVRQRATGTRATGTRALTSARDHDDRQPIAANDRPTLLAHPLLGARLPAGLAPARRHRRAHRLRDPGPRGHGVRRAGRHAAGDRVLCGADRAAGVRDPGQLAPAVVAVSSAIAIMSAATISVSRPPGAWSTRP